MSQIRDKALKVIIETIKNNILFPNKCSTGGSTNANNDELSVVNIEQLVRYLIQWFSFNPILNENDVLDLLILILAVCLHKITNNVQLFLIITFLETRFFQHLKKKNNCY